MNKVALKMRLVEIADLLLVDKNTEALENVFGIIDDINDELNPQPIVETYQEFNMKRDYSGKQSGWTDKGVK